MSERTSGEGNTDAPRVEENEVRSGDGHRNQERGSTQGMSYELSHGYKKTSWTSVIFGWLAALGAGLILSGIVGGIVGGILGALGVQGGTEGGIAGLVGLLLTLLLAFLIGGYVAGRLASRSGFKHGILVPVLAIVGTIVGASFIDQLSGVALPQVPGNVQNQAPQSLGTVLTASGIAALVVPFVGGALGGLWGAKTGRNRP
jgi:hypothetical protein